MKLFLGNNKEVLKTFESNSIDSIVTDPPYELGFMGKSWDSTGIAYDVELWSELLRVLKPGGHLLAFSGTRTYHRMASAIEDAGFEVRDMIEWVYGSGFPKSLNIGKAINKIDGVEFDSKPASGVGFMNNNTEDGYHPTINQLVQKGESSDRAKQWNGWGTALKPAHEPICMARKPLSEKSVAENCLKYGTGGINIDESRVGCDLEQEDLSRGRQSNGGAIFGSTNKEIKIEASNLGRFPANLIHDGSEEVMSCFPEASKGWGKATDSENSKQNSMFGIGGVNANRYDMGGGNASRFFKSIIYTSKPSKAERNLGCEPVFNLFEQSEWLEEKEFCMSGNNSEKLGDLGFNKQKNYKNFHPTVKPIELMEYLIKMVTPKGGIVLDPFMGSGSTGCGAVKNGFDFIGIDLTPEYLKIAEKRIKRYSPII